MRSAAATFSLYDIFLHHITTGKTNNLLKYKFSKIIFYTEKSLQLR